MRIALVGNQNSGKTTLFNLLTGQNQKIGNWPGVTLERKVGYLKGTDHEIVDLPGIYSLSPYTLEENVSRDFLYNEKPDLIINIVDATNIERSLYLTTQLLELDLNVIVALNMADILEKKGIKIQVDKLKDALKTEVILISALKRSGIQELRNRVQSIEHTNLNQRDLLSLFHLELEVSLKEIEKQIDLDHKRFSAIKLLEEDVKFEKYKTKEIQSIIDKQKKNTKVSLEETVVNARYSFIEKIKKEVLEEVPTTVSATDKIDKILLNKWLGIPTFVVIMFFIYYLSVGVVGSATVDFVSSLFETIAEGVAGWLEKIGASGWSNSLVVDGIISGVGAVLNFVPQLIILFLLISILEVTGYMTRISFLLDRLFRKLGLSGKSLIPFIVGTGCGVPGVMATRTIENKDEREMSILLTPFVPCSAKLPIIALFASAFFPKHSGLVAASLYFFAVIVIILSALILKRFYHKAGSNVYITELPEYKLPNVKYVVRDVYDKTAEFFKRAGTIILLLSVVNWFLVSFNWRLQYGIDVNESMLAGIGNVFGWVFYPILGEWSWGSTVAAFQGLIAKEAVNSTMAVINGVDIGILALGEIDPEIITAGAGIFSFFTPASAYAFMVFNLFSAPCIGAMGAMRREYGSTKKMFKAIAFQTGLAWVLAVLVFQIANLIGVIF